MPEANLFLMFTQRLNALGVAYMVSGRLHVCRSWIHNLEETIPGEVNFIYWSNLP